jgi:hypothetical protein
MGRIAELMRGTEAQIENTPEGHGLSHPDPRISEPARVVGSLRNERPGLRLTWRWDSSIMGDWFGVKYAVTLSSNPDSYQTLA